MKIYNFHVDIKTIIKFKKIIIFLDSIIWKKEGYLYIQFSCYSFLLFSTQQSFFLFYFTWIWSEFYRYSKLLLEPRGSILQLTHMLLFYTHCNQRVERKKWQELHLIVWVQTKTKTLSLTELFILLLHPLRISNKIALKFIRVRTKFHAFSRRQRPPQHQKRKIRFLRSIDQSYWRSLSLSSTLTPKWTYSYF